MKLKLQGIKQMLLLHHLYIQESETAFLDSKIKADLECLSRIEFVVYTENKQSSVELLPFLVK